MRIRTAIAADYLVRVGKQPDLGERRTAAVLVAWGRCAVLLRIKMPYDPA